MLATSLVSLLLMATALHGATLKGSSPPTSDSIYGGGNADIKDYPYQVSLRFESNLICEGSIIANEWILTAAHCIKYEGKNLYVVAGTSNLNEEGTVHQVDKIIVHPNFRYTDKNVPVDDIALLKLDKPIVYDDKHQAIELFNKDEETRPGALGVVTGFGRTRQGFLNQLQFVVVPIMSPTICDIVYSHKMPNKQFCAAYYEVGVKDACEGNSGGPLTINGRLAGIVSWGNGCGEPKHPSVYTEVARYRDWISSTMKNV